MIYLFGFPVIVADTVQHTYERTYTNIYTVGLSSTLLICLPVTEFSFSSLQQGLKN